jgi:CMP/dCMP kinase
MMNLPRIIAIDGPAASGKTTIGKLLADHFHYLFFDTGVMYRAITWLALERSIPVENEDDITNLAQQTTIDILPPSKHDGRTSDIMINGQDITWEIRHPSVDASVSVVSAYPGVRKALTQQQRQIGLRGEVVMVGRDIGTVVLPEAELKIFLDASVKERANRRLVELQKRGEKVEMEDILQALQNRDAIDSTRSIAPLKPASDAVIVGTDQLSIEQVYTQILQLIKETSSVK